MKGFSIAVNDWGVHAILYTGFAEADSAAWLSALREVRDRVGKRGRAPGLFLDLRDVLDGAVSPAHLDGVVGQLARTGLGRSAVLLSDPALAKRLGAAFDKAADRAADKTAASGLRIILSDGRDRVLIAAAYGWILNGREPAAVRPPLSGDILPFPKASTAPDHPAPARMMRAAS